MDRRKLAWLTGGILFFVFSKMVFSGEEMSSRIRTPSSEDEKGEGIGEDWIGFGSEKLWRIRPTFDFETIYDSNVNRESPGHTNPDVIFNFTPSIQLTRQGTHFGVTGDYSPVYQQYVSDTRQSAFNHAFGTQLWLTEEKLTAKFDESFKWTKAYATSEQSERRTIIYNDINPEVIYQLTSRFSASALYQSYLFNYTDSPLRDRSYVNNEYGGRIYYHATHKFDVYIQGSAIFVDYYKSGQFDSKGFGVYVGSFGKLTERVLINGQMGFLDRTYDDSSINPYQNWVWEAVIKYRLTKKIGLSLQGKRDVQESVYQNTGWYGPNRVGLGFQYQATTHVTIEGNGDFQDNRYPTETIEGTATKKRNDDLLLAGLKLVWKPIRHLILTVGYSFRQRVSNFKDFNYADHAVESSIGYQF